MLKKNRFIENFIYEKIRFFTNLTYNYNNRYIILNKIRIMHIVIYRNIKFRFFGNK